MPDPMPHRVTVHIYAGIEGSGREPFHVGSVDIDPNASPRRMRRAFTAAFQALACIAGPKNAGSPPAH